MGKLRTLPNNHHEFQCPSCKESHTIGPTWLFNNDFNKPTFSPSLLVRSGHFVSNRASKECWCTYNEEQRQKGEVEEPVFSCFICHSFIKDGQIQFLSDCTHSLASQTVELPEVE